MEIGILIIIVVLVVLGKIVFDKSKKTSQMEKTYSNVTELQQFIDAVKRNGKIPTIKTSLILKSDEEAYLEEYVKLYEIRSASKSDRLYVGGRVMKGIYVGGSTGVSRRFDELREIDAGKLVLTNKRIIFDGNFNNRIMDLDKIISIELYDDGFEIATEDKRQSQLYGGIRNPFLWKNLTTAVIKTKGLENVSLDNDDLKDIRKAEAELNQLSEDLKKRLNKS
jgi:hypothetical protein